MPELTAEQWRALRSALVETVRARVPGWSEGQESDPGITLLALMAFLAEGLDVAGPSHSAERAELAGRIIDRLREACIPETINAAGGGEVWTGVKRVRFFNGQLLSARDFADEQRYHLRKQRLHASRLHRPGIVDGLSVDVQPDGSLTVSPGLAIDRSGRTICLGQPLRLTVAGTGTSACLVARYQERETDAVQAFGSEQVAEASRIEEGSRWSFESAPAADGILIARLALTAAGWQRQDDDPD
jgi:hypothetical protein